MSALSKVVNYDSSIVLAAAIMIVNYNCKTFIPQAADVFVIKIGWIFLFKCLVLCKMD
jgi:hypothetical protein